MARRDDVSPAIMCIGEARATTGGVLTCTVGALKALAERHRASMAKLEMY